jgi:hypothetical protein
MRNMSFMLTTQQFRARTKHVTRRLNWPDLKTGDVVMGIVKGMGLKPGEKIEELGPIEILDEWWEQLDAITQSECVKEGFPAMTPDDFVEMFSNHMKCHSKRNVHRIGYRYLDKWRASNSTDGFAFSSKYCDKCWHDRRAEKDPEKGCKVLLASMMWRITDQEYPKEWVTDHTSYTGWCTKFQSMEEHEAAKKPYKPRVSKLQMVLL